MAWPTAMETLHHLPGSTWDVAWTVRPREGESVCGDTVRVLHDDNALLVAVIDGLGHGHGAHKASSQASEELATAFDDGSRQLDVLLRTIHERIRSTRGVAISLLHVTDSLIRFAGVGNVACATTFPEFRPFPREGILGYRYQNTGMMETGRTAGRVALYSDGLAMLRLDDTRELHASRVPTELLATHGTREDDASVAVIDIHHTE